MAPVAIAAYEPAMPLVGETVVFDGSNSVDPDGTIVTYIWQFGDGDVGEGVNVTHAYEHEGVHEVILTVIDGDMLSDENRVNITVASIPVAEILYSPSSPEAGTVITFYGYGSYDEGGIVQYEWSFGDGTYANGWEVSHVYAESGTYEVRLTVTNIYGIQTSTAVELDLDKGNHGVTGEVVNVNLKPIKDALVEVRNQGALVASTLTDSEGEFVIKDLAPGEYQLSISKQGYSTLVMTIEIGSGMQDLGTIVLSKVSGSSSASTTADPSDDLIIGALAAALVAAGLASIAVVKLRRRSKT
jgi:PKD repeat protein